MVVPFYFVALLAGIMPGVWLYRVFRRRPYGNFCPACGYNLTGNISGVCPECGRSVAPAKQDGSLA